MKGSPSLQELLQTVYRFYPVRLHEDAPGYRATPEMQRLAEARRRALEERAAWDHFLERARESLPGFGVDDWSFRLQAGHDACYHARITLPGINARSARRDEVVVMASILAPVAFIYTSVTTKRDRHSSRRLFPCPIHATHEAYARCESLVHEIMQSPQVRRALLFLSVPDVEYGNHSFGEVRLVDCLFLPHLW